MIVDLVNIAKNINKNSAVHCVILQGEGASFCAGLDFDYVAKNGFIDRTRIINDYQ